MNTPGGFIFFSTDNPPCQFPRKGLVTLLGVGHICGWWLAQGLVAPDSEEEQQGGGHVWLLIPGLLVLPRPSPDQQTEFNSPKKHRAGMSKAREPGV